LVTARELGFSAVMSVRHVMRLLDSAQQVRLDGRNRTIEILTPP
jgi:hypothetical protein